MKAAVTLALIGVAALAGAASARQSSDPAHDIVATRKAGFAMSAVTVNAINAGVEGGAPLASQRFAVGALQKWAHAIPGAFPAGTSAADLPGQTMAKPEIWSDRAGFEAKAADYAAAVDTLASLAQGSDAEAFEDQFAVVRQSCGSCHNPYRIERPRG